MNGYAEDMEEVRRRVEAHQARAQRCPTLEMPPVEVFIAEQPSNAVLSEDAHAETQPTGAAVGFAALSGLCLTLLILFGPKLLQLLWAITR